MIDLSIPLNSIPEEIIINIDLFAEFAIDPSDSLSHYDSCPQLAMTTSDGNDPPTANITSPTDGSDYDEGDTIIFSGTGDD